MELRAMSVGGHGRTGGRRANLRTALILLSVAAAFFAGIVAKHWLLG